MVALGSDQEVHALQQGFQQLRKTLQTYFELGPGGKVFKLRQFFP